MFETPTVIITGAGTSVEFGLPSGKDIFQSLQKQAEESTSHWNGQPQLINDGIIPTPSLTFRNLISVIEKKEKNLLPQLLKIGQKIEIQFDDSIDEYLFNNQEFQNIGKLLSIWRLYCSLYQEAFSNNRKILSRRSDHMLKTSPSKNASKSWLASLAHKITKNCLTIEDLKKNKLSILTFNYDPLIEEGLISLIRGSGRFSNIKNLDFIEIIHVNGELKMSDSFNLNVNGWSGEPVLSQDIFEEININTKNIFMINEDTNLNIIKSRKIAKNLIQNSHKIFSLGFAFDPNNVRLIGLDALGLEQELYALNYNGDVQLKNRIRMVSENKTTIIGTPDKSVSASEATAQGFFDH